MKKEWKPLLICGLISVLTIGLMTSFKYNDVEIQMHDSYFIIDPARACIYLAAIIFTIRNLFLVIDQLTERYKILAVFVAIINPIAALFMIMLTYFYITFMMGAGQPQIGDKLVESMVLTSLMVALIVVQISIEIKVLQKLRKFMA